MNVNPKVVEAAQKMLLQFLRSTAKQKNISINEIVERTGLKQSYVSRVLTNEANVTLKTYITIAAALDCYLFLEDKNANTENTEFMEKRFGDISEN